MVEINRSLNLLYPPFRRLIEAGLAEAHHGGLMAYVFEGYRASERQAFLYAQGRSNAGQRVTNARAGFSWHQYGLAVDLVFDATPITKKIDWTWEGGYADANGDNYDKLAKIMKARGLEWLGDSKIERAHFQKSYGLTIEEAKTITTIKGVLGLWHELDKRGGF